MTKCVYPNTHQNPHTQAHESQLRRRDYVLLVPKTSYANLQSPNPPPNLAGINWQFVVEKLRPVLLLKESKNDQFVVDCAKLQPTDLASSSSGGQSPEKLTLESISSWRLTFYSYSSVLPNFVTMKVQNDQTKSLMSLLISDPVQGCRFITTNGLSDELYSVCC